MSYDEEIDCLAGTVYNTNPTSASKIHDIMQEIHDDIIFELFIKAMNNNKLKMINILFDDIIKIRDDEYILEYAIKCHNLNLCKLIIKKMFIDRNKEFACFTIDTFSTDVVFVNQLFKYLLSIGHVSCLDDNLCFCWSNMSSITNLLVI